MRIIALGEFPPKTQTGVSISNKLVCDILSQNGHSVTTIEEYSWNKNRFFVILHYLGIYLKVFRLFLFSKTDVFYFNIPMSFQAQLKIFPVLILSKLKPATKRVAHLHRGDFSTYSTSGNLQKKLLKKYLSSLFKLIVLSDKFKAEVLEFEPELNIDVLANTSEFEGAVFEKKEYSGKFTCISNYIESKGVRDLLECFISPEFNELSLEMYGVIYDKALYAELERKSTSNITLKGELSRSEVKDILQNTDCLIIPSWNEGQPIIILEAMSLGIPVIATKVGDIPEMLKDWPYQANPKDIESLSTQILAFHQTKDKPELQERIRNMYHSKYAFEKYKVHLKAIFDF